MKAKKRNKNFSFPYVRMNNVGKVRTLIRRADKVLLKGDLEKGKSLLRQAICFVRPGVHADDSQTAVEVGVSGTYLSSENSSESRAAWGIMEAFLRLLPMSKKKEAVPRA